MYLRFKLFCWQKKNLFRRYGHLRRKWCFMAALLIFMQSYRRNKLFWFLYSPYPHVEKWGYATKAVFCEIIPPTSMRFRFMDHTLSLSPDLREKIPSENRLFLQYLRLTVSQWESRDRGLSYASVKRWRSWCRDISSEFSLDFLYVIWRETLNVPSWRTFRDSLSSSRMKYLVWFGDRYSGVYIHGTYPFSVVNLKLFLTREKGNVWIQLAKKCHILISISENENGIVPFFSKSVDMNCLIKSTSLAYSYNILS